MKGIYRYACGARHPRVGVMEHSPSTKRILTYSTHPNSGEYHRPLLDDGTEPDCFDCKCRKRARRLDKSGKCFFDDGTLGYAILILCWPKFEEAEAQAEAQAEGDRA